MSYTQNSNINTPIQNHTQHFNIYSDHLTESINRVSEPGINANSIRKKDLAEILKMQHDETAKTLKEINAKLDYCNTSLNEFKEFKVLVIQQITELNAFKDNTNTHIQ